MTTPSPSPAAFDLRCRDAEWIDRPQTLDDFSRAAPLPMSVRYGGLGEALVADMVARSNYEIEDLARGRTILSCQMPRYGIPLGVRDLDRPPTQEWNMREELRGELIEVEGSGRIAHSVAMQVRRGLIAVAGALPLLVVSTPALASPGAGNVELVVEQAEAEQVEAEHGEQDAPAPSLPEDKQAAPAEGPAPADPTAAPATANAAPPPTPAEGAPAARVSGNTLSLNGMVVWEGLLGKLVRLELKDGKSLAGTVVAQSSGDLAVARASDGMVVAVPKAQVAGVRLRPESAGVGAVGSKIPVDERPTQDGRGAVAGGVLMVSMGSVAALSGTVFLGITPSYVFISLPLLLPGLAMIAGGSALIAAGGKKRRAFNEAWGIPAKLARVTPTVTAGRQGGQVGLVLRF